MALVKSKTYTVFLRDGSSEGVRLIHYFGVMVPVKKIVFTLTSYSARIDESGEGVRASCTLLCREC